MGIGFVKSPFVRGKFAILGYPIKPNQHPLINSMVSGHPPHFSFVHACGNNSRKRTALLTDTFFNSRGRPLTRELTVTEKTLKANLHGTIFAYDCRMRFL